jgi:hypothetical protein
MYLLAEHYVRLVYLNLFVGRGVKFMKHFKGRASYKSLGASGI